MSSPLRLEEMRRAAHEAMKTTSLQKASWKRSLGLVLVFNGVLTLTLAALMSRVPMPIASHWGIAGVSLAAFLIAGVFAAIAPAVRPSRFWVVFLVLCVAAMTLAFTPWAVDGQSLWPAGMPCLTTEIALSVVPVTLCIWLLRRFAYHPMRTWLGVLASGLVGLFTLHWHCQVLTVEHVLLFHLVPWLGIGAIGVWVRSKMRSKTFAP